MDHVHRRLCLQEKAEWLVPETAGSEEANQMGLSGEAWGSVGLKLSLIKSESKCSLFKVLRQGQGGGWRGVQMTDM